MLFFVTFLCFIGFESKSKSRIWLKRKIAIFPQPKNNRIVKVPIEVVPAVEKTYKLMLLNGSRLRWNDVECAFYTFYEFIKNEV